MSSNPNTSDFDITAYCNNPANETAIADCYLYSTFSQSIQDLSDGVNVFFLVATGALAFLRPAGFIMIWTGMVREKNVVNTLIRSLMDSCFGCLVFWMVGFAFAFGANDPSQKTFIGNQNFFVRNFNQGFGELASFYFQLVFAQTAATVVTGVLTERAKMAGFFWYTSFVTAFAYPVAAHCVWSKEGYLSPFNNKPFRDVGAIDFGGSGVVHFLAGLIALIAAIFLGPRRGRFYDVDGKILDKPAPIRFYSPSFLLLGTFILWVGWIGFNPGSAMYTTNPQIATAVGLSPVTTTLSAASGALAALLLDTLVEVRKDGHVSYDITMGCNGAIAGLVASSANCAIVSTWASVVIGAIGAWVFYFCEKLLIRLRIDDSSDAIPVHLGAGLWGVIATGLFANPYYMELAGYNPEHPGWFYRGNDGNLLLCQVCLIFYIVAWVCAIMIPFFWALSRFGLFRVDPDDEDRGLDYVFHRIIDDDDEDEMEIDLHKQAAAAALARAAAATETPTTAITTNNKAATNGESN